MAPRTNSLATFICCVLFLVPSALKAATLDLAKTGQTVCYDSADQELIYADGFE